MGIYSDSNNTDYGLNMRNYVECLLVDDLTHHYGIDTIREFCAPNGVGDALVEAKVLGKRTFVRLSKMDDLDRRSTMAALQLAREANDPLWKKLTIVQAKRKELIAKIKQKYSSKSHRVAMVGQKEYIKTMRKVPRSFMQAGGADRV